MAEITARETLLVSSGFAVLAPDPSSAFPSGGATADSGLRTAPPRETGGNIDIKQLTAGSVVTLPVDVPGALFSAGDCHFAQGDGEVTGTAIEITGKVRLRFSVVKPAEQLWQPRFPTFEYREEPTRIARRYIGTTGIPVNSDGQNGYLDLTMAAEEAVREMIACLVGTRGLTRAQAYVLVSVAGDLRISECVDVPNAMFRFTYRSMCSKASRRRRKGLGQPRQWLDSGIGDEHRVLDDRRPQPVDDDHRLEGKGHSRLENVGCHQVAETRRLEQHATDAVAEATGHVVLAVAELGGNADRVLVEIAERDSRLGQLDDGIEDLPGSEEASAFVRGLSDRNAAADVGVVAADDRAGVNEDEVAFLKRTPRRSAVLHSGALRSAGTAGSKAG